MADVPFRVILDTNLWISYLISSDLIILDRFLREGLIRLLFSRELIDEFISVSRRPKFKKYFSEESVIELLESMAEYADLVEVSAKVQVCKDPKDDFLLALAQDGAADYLVTGDKALLEVGSFRNTKIVTFRDFVPALQI